MGYSFSKIRSCRNLPDPIESVMPENLNYVQARIVPLKPPSLQRNPQQAPPISFNVPKK